MEGLALSVYCTVLCVVPTGRPVPAALYRVDSHETVQHLDRGFGLGGLWHDLQDDDAFMVGELRLGVASTELLDRLTELIFDIPVELCAADHHCAVAGMDTERQPQG